jgi:hypothetical protein
MTWMRHDSASPDAAAGSVGKASRGHQDGELLDTDSMMRRNCSGSPISHALARLATTTFDIAAKRGNFGGRF